MAHTSSGRKKLLKLFVRAQKIISSVESSTVAHYHFSRPYFTLRLLNLPITEGLSYQRYNGDLKKTVWLKNYLICILKNPGFSDLFHAMKRIALIKLLRLSEKYYLCFISSCYLISSHWGKRAICGMSLLVLYSAPRGFSTGTPVFPSPQKPTINLICSYFS